MSLDPDKAPSSIATEIYCHGIRLISRYRKAHEFSLMTKMAEAIHRAGPFAVVEIFCDSKATHVFSIASAGDHHGVVAEIVHLVCVATNGGHNGIWVRDCNGDDGVEIDPYWDIDDELMA